MGTSSNRVNQLVSDLDIDIDEIERRPQTVRIRCRDCVFHKKQATYAKPCSQLGIPGDSDPCNRHTVDTRALQQKDVAAFVRLLRYINAAKITNMGAMISLLSGARNAKRLGYALGDTVWVSGHYGPGKPTTASYYRSTVIGASGNRLVVMGDNGLRGLVGPGNNGVIREADWPAFRDTLAQPGSVEIVVPLRKLRAKSRVTVKEKLGGRGRTVRADPKPGRRKNGKAVTLKLR